MPPYDSLVAGGTVILRDGGATRCDIGIRDGRIVAIDDDLPRTDANEVVDARNRIVFPGGVDAHYHLGIYRPLAEDARSETESSLVGGATTVISYFRTGQHYLNRTGPYREILPEVVASIDGNTWTDVGFHIAPMTTSQLDEIDWMVGEAGIASFKYFMFYKGLNLAGDSTDAQAFTMSDSYDFGHLYALMEKVRDANAKYGKSGRISLSLHCENAELIKFFIKRLRQDIPPLRAYAEARPPVSERLSIHEAGVLASDTGVNLNLLHLSSADALTAALQVRQLYPSLDIRCETTLHHLCLTHAMLEGKGLGGKVNPPLRTEADNEALWEGVARGDINWIASDHACCLESMKGEELWHAYAGFGGTALLYPVLISEGHHRRGLSLERVAELASTAPAAAFGCRPRKGSIAVGADADLAIVDLDQERTVTPEILHSAQDFTPFEGMKIRGWPVLTMLRGQVAFRNGAVSGPPSGAFLKRPVRSDSPSPNEA